MDVVRPVVARQPILPRTVIRVRVRLVQRHDNQCTGSIAEVLPLCQVPIQIITVGNRFVPVPLILPDELLLRVIGILRPVRRGGLQHAALLFRYGWNPSVVVIRVLQGYRQRKKGAFPVGTHLSELQRAYPGGRAIGSRHIGKALPVTRTHGIVVPHAMLRHASVVVQLRLIPFPVAGR